MEKVKYQHELYLIKKEVKECKNTNGKNWNNVNRKNIKLRGLYI